MIGNTHAIEHVTVGALVAYKLINWLALLLLDLFLYKPWCAIEPSD